MLKHSIATLFILLIMIAVRADPGQVTLSFRLKGAEIIYYNYVSPEGISIWNRLQGNQQEISISSAQAMLISYPDNGESGKYIPYYAEPGDTLRVAIQNGKTAVSSSNKTYPHQHLLLVRIYRQLGDIWLSEKQKTYLANPNFAEVEQLLRQWHDQRSDFLEKEWLADRISIGAKSYFQLFFQHEYLSGLMGYMTRRRGNRQLITGDFSAFLDSAKNLLSPFNTNAYLPAYATALKYFCQVKQGILPDKPFPALEHFQFMNTVFPSETAAYFFYRYAGESCRKGLKIPTDMLSHFMQQPISPEWKTQFQNWLAESNMQMQLKNISQTAYLQDGMGRIYSWEEWVQLNNNQPVYIDFWASWCAPCREKMEFARNLESTYKNRQLKVLYVSIDESKENWLAAISSDKGDISRNFRLLFPKETPLLKKINLASIPAYAYIPARTMNLRTAPPPEDKNLPLLFGN